jgi:hypothetical protein
MWARLWLFAFALHAAPVFSQGPLTSGKVFKLSVPEEGVYKISYDFLKRHGADPGSLNPQNIRLFGNDGGMLPQANSQPRPEGLQEVPIFINGEADGKFDKSDYILFFGTGATRADLLPNNSVFRYQNNLYSTVNYYFLVIGEDPGIRITDVPNTETPSPVINSFRDFVYHELDEHNELHSGREWYGEKLGLTSSITFDLDVPGIVPGTPITLVSDVMGQSYESASFKVFLNNAQVGEQFILPITNGRYSGKGYDRRDTLSINESATGSSSSDKQQLRFDFVKASGFSQGYIDFFLANFTRELRLYGDKTVFSVWTTSPSLAFDISDVPVDAQIWDITDHHQIRNQQYFLTGSTATFSTNAEGFRKFIVFKGNAPSPGFEGEVSNQDIRNLSTPNLIIVTDPLLLEQAQRLAAHRQQHGWSVAVVTTEMIFNEFSSGRQDVVAIRDFMKLLFDKSPSTLKALLLFGKCSYDYKDRIDDNFNLVPTYESRNSLSPLATYSSDDFYGFLEASEGEWQESPARNHTLDIGVGRLPVKNAQEASAVVNKIIAYDSEKSQGYWRKKIVFVADDGNGDDGFTTLHQEQADQLAEMIEEEQPAFDIKKLFMGEYPKTVRPSGETVGKMTDDIVRSFEDGALIINYTGHGSEQLWADERVFSDQTIARLKNTRYPFLVTATCEFGRHDDPFQTSSAELAITRPDGGAIGMVTTARPVNATTNFNLNQAFYEALFNRTAGSYPSLAEVFMATKNNSTSGVANRNFSLLADPSMTLALPPDVVRVTSVKTVYGSDTLKALSHVIVKGHIEDPAGNILSGFNGIAEASLFNKQTDYVTIGRNDPAFQFKEWSNVLFRGKATVTDGQFELEFILPKNISYSVGAGRLSLYAYDKSRGDANGSADNFKVGGTEKAVAPDETAPAITLFMGDSTFIDGGLTTADSYLLAILSDESGINISDYGLGNGIVAVLDDAAETYVLNDYYVADADNYKKGRIRFPVFGLTPGPHTLTLKAWDVHNNSGVARVNFTVTDGDGIRIETLANYPNPFVNQTTIFFTHNRSGDDLEAQLFIYSPSGNLIKSVALPVSQSEYKIDVLTLDNGLTEEKKLPAGLYLARLIVRSLTNGSKNEQVTKLIVLN